VIGFQITKLANNSVLLLLESLATSQFAFSMMMLCNDRGVGKCAGVSEESSFVTDKVRVLP